MVFVCLFLMCVHQDLHLMESATEFFEGEGFKKMVNTILMYMHNINREQHDLAGNQI